MSQGMPVLIDCDPGYDDAVALMLAFGSGLEVLGVTTVAGNAAGADTYRNALKILSFIGAHVKVGRGADKPLLRDLVVAANVHGESGLGGPCLPESDLPEQQQSALDLITGAIESYPGKVTLIPTGPLTNVATVFLARPDLKEKIRSIVLMGGAAYEGNVTPAAEFNMHVDPEAARIVLQSGVPVAMIGLDATHQALIYPDEVEKLRSMGGAGKVAAELIDFSSSFHRKQGFPGNPVHDGLAVAAVIDPGVVSLESLYVDVELRGEITTGRTVMDFRGVTGKPANCQVALKVDRDRFIRMLFDAIASLNRTGTAGGCL